MRIFFTVRPAQNSPLTNLLGFKVSLTKTDGPRTIGFSATYGFTPGLFIYQALSSTPNSNHLALGFSATYGFTPGLFIYQTLSSTSNSNNLALRLSEGTSLRSELAVTCARDQTPLVTSTSAQQLRVRAASGRGHKMSSVF